MKLPVGDEGRRDGNGMGNLPPLGQISSVLLSALGLASNRVWPSAFGIAQPAEPSPFHFVQKNYKCCVRREQFQDQIGRRRIHFCGVYFDFHFITLYLCREARTIADFQARAEYSVVFVGPFLVCSEVSGLWAQPHLGARHE